MQVKLDSIKEYFRNACNKADCLGVTALEKIKKAKAGCLSKDTGWHAQYWDIIGDHPQSKRVSRENYKVPELHHLS